MQDLDKVSSTQLSNFWRNLSVALMVLIGVMLLSQILPYYFSPIVALIGAAVLYTILYNGKLHDMSCMVIPYSIFYCLISYSFFSIVLNVLFIWGMIELPKEIIFFAAPYIPSLILDPICFITLIVMYLRRNSLSICVDCKFTRGLSIERGRLGAILQNESKFQLRNLISMFGILSVAVWVYFFTYYDKSADLNGRDNYIFFWLNLIVFVVDLIYFVVRYYNIYLDLKDSGQIITEEELSDMTSKTYLRFYVVCGNSLYLTPKAIDKQSPFREVIDTPFVTKRNVNGITTDEVNRIIKNLTGVTDGHLRFFFGRRIPDMTKHSLLRYFYFLDGSPEDYPELKLQGEWMDFNRIKGIYSKSPSLLDKTFLSDISRTTTIILTQKIFDDRGYRKIKVKSYQPTYDLQEIRDNDYDFQDDKWVRIAMFNSDTKGFYMRRMWKKMVRRNEETAWKE